jgi:predicted extracellular nuclease
MFSRRAPRTIVRFLLVTLSCAFAGTALPPPAHAISTDVVISQVYGGGGNAGATLKNDFIELHNRGTGAVSLTGWTVQYASASGSTWTPTPLSGSIAPGGYYLVQEAQGTGGSLNLPTPDATGTISMSATSAKVALVNVASALSGVCPSGSSIVDLVGYGTSASCFESSPTSTLSNTTAAIRASAGCKETDDNLADFIEDTPTPRNTASTAVSCQVTLTVVVDPAAGGTVARAPDQTSYLIGTPVLLTATHATGYHFLNWSGDATGTANAVTVTMDADKTVTAHFALLPGNDDIVISEIYGGGGNAGATYRRDFIELYNRGGGPVDVTGWTVQYSVVDGSTWTTTTLLGTIPQGGYYLVAEFEGAGGTLDLPTPDIIHDIPIHAVEGKVAVVRNNIPLSGACPSGPEIADMVGYGGANCFEASPAIALDNLTAAHRNDDGCRDTNDNAADFVAAAPTPRNSASPINICAFWVSVDDRATTGFALRPLVPNPTRSGSRVSFELPREARIRLDVLDIQGRAVALLAEGVFSAGVHEVHWDGANQSGLARSGIYFIRLQIPGGRLVRRVAVTL